MPTTPAIPAEKLALFDKIVAGVPGIERKGAAIPYTSVNGNMFSFFTAEGKLAIRLPDQARESFREKFKTSVLRQHGVVMKEYVEVPDKLLANTAEMHGYFAASVAYARTLKPKATTRKKSTPGTGAGKKTVERKSRQKKA